MATKLFFILFPLYLIIAGFMAVYLGLGWWSLIWPVWIFLYLRWFFGIDSITH